MGSQAHIPESGTPFAQQHTPMKAVLCRVRDLPAAETAGALTSCAVALTVAAVSCTSPG